MSRNEVVIIEVKRKPLKCIYCGGKVVPILYGEPNEEGEKLINESQRIMGGYCFG